MHRYLFLLLFPLVLVACDSTGVEVCDDTADCAVPPTAVFIGNQGNFSDGDGSVTAYDPDTDTAVEPITDLRSIVQSVAVYGGRLYVTANTGGRVEVYDAATYASVGTVEVENPRYVAYDGSRGRLYVSKQLYDRPSEVAVVDVATLDVVETIAVGGLAEGIVVARDRAFVATGAFGASQEVVVIDLETNSVVERIDVGCVSPRSLARDAVGEVWVFCAGAAATENQDEIPGAVVVLDAASGDEVARIAVDGLIATAGPGQDVFASHGIDVFTVRDQDTILRFSAETNTFVEAIPVPGDPIGAVAVSRAGQLYLGRVPGFDVRGGVTIHDDDGTQIGSFTAGVAPTSITLAE